MDVKNIAKLNCYVKFKEQAGNDTVYCGCEKLLHTYICGPCAVVETCTYCS